MAEHAQGLALVVEFPLLRFRATMTRPPHVVAAFVNFLAASAVVGLDVSVRIAVSAASRHPPIQPDLSTLSSYGIRTSGDLMVDIPACETPSRQLGPAGV